jgi:hypothetical protein
MSSRSWTERAASDPSLQAFIAAEIARAVVDLSVAQSEATRWRRVAEHLDERLKELRRGDAQANNKTRQARHRRRHAFVSLYPEAPA